MDGLEEKLKKRAHSEAKLMLDASIIDKKKNES